MTIVLIIICVVAIIFLTNKRKEIDEKEKIALKTPGRASRLREHYGDVLELFLQNPNHQLVFEREYDQSVRLSNNKGQELFMSYSSLGAHGPELRVVCIQNSMVLKEWCFDKRESSQAIYLQIIDYFL